MELALIPAPSRFSAGETSTLFAPLNCSRLSTDVSWASLSQEVMFIPLKQVGGAYVRRGHLESLSESQITDLETGDSQKNIHYFQQDW
jgi:hypothetical protein